MQTRFWRNILLPKNFLNEYPCKKIEESFGYAGTGLILHLLADAQNGKKYYLELTDDVIANYTKELAIALDVITFAVDRGMFCREMFVKYRILTNRWLQEAHLCKNDRRRIAEFDKRYFLLDEYADRVKLI